jgi:formylglycine-generating enzyme required for sulfatase activity
MYPEGASADGVLDMAGTVWEWCLNQYEAPYSTTIDPGDDRPRVLRGGSWNFNQAFARCPLRISFNPLARSNNIGFRVVCLSPS